MMQEIWILQPRFEQRTKKRVHRLMAHPRFRAAYDFLLLRAPESAEVAELGEWWTQVQGTSGADLADALATVAEAPEANADQTEAVAVRKPSGRRRRRRAGPPPAAE
jgi:poly(A) polymerase